MKRKLNKPIFLLLAAVLVISSFSILAYAEDRSEVFDSQYVEQGEPISQEVKSEEEKEAEIFETEINLPAPEVPEFFADGTTATTYSHSGDGTEASPYIISTEDDLIALALGQYDNAYKAHYILKNNIELTADTWTPIGATSSTAFQGVFDGDGHTISSTVLFQSTGMSGIFGVNNGTIKNLNVDVSISNVATDAGALVATNNGRIENCYSSGSISATSSCKIGGLVGYNTGIITKSGSSVTVTASNSTVGGLVGYNYNNGVVQYSYATGDVTGKNVGGLIGEQYAYSSGTTAKTLYCYSLGKVTGSSNAGGLIGYNHNYYYSSSDQCGATYVEYCYAKGVVASGSPTGGLVGGTKGSYNYFKFCYYNKTNTGNKIGFGISISDLKKQSSFYGWNFDNIWAISADKNEGYPYIELNGEEEIVISGIGSQLDPYIIENENQLQHISAHKLSNSMSAYYLLANDITVTANFWTPIGRYSTFTGCFDGNGHTIYGVNISNTDFANCGLFDNNRGTIKNLTVSGVSIVGNTYTGSIVGVNNGTISNCFVKDSTVSNASGNYVGGMVGHNAGKITECGVECDIVSSNATVGGLVGQNYNNGIVQYSYAAGDVTGSTAGGLIGEQYAYSSGTTTKTLNSYSMGKVTGSSNAGGLIGYNHNYYYSSSDQCGATYVEYCYARGLVAGSGSTGGLIGSLEGSYNVVRYCYYNQANTGNKIGFSVPANLMNEQSTFYMWNFDNIWASSKAVNGGCPYIDLRGTVKEYELEGYGDADDPYQIYTERDLWALVDGTYNLSAKLYFQLQNDIVITANYWTPIGSNGYANFNGIFDGNGYTISGLKFSNNYYDNVGFIGVNTGTIKNLNVEAVFEGVNYVGAICAQNSGTVDSCSSKGVISNRNSGQREVGGLVGYNTGAVKNSYSVATVYAPNHNAGGLLGKNYNNGVVQYCYATGNVTGKNAGGLIGEQYAYSSNTTSKTLNSYSMGKVTGSSNAGGLIGYNRNYVYSSSSQNGATYVQYCYSNGKVGGNGTKGGLIGAINGSYNTVTSAYYNTTLSEMTDINRGTPLDDNTMKLQASYVGWDFDTVWSIDSATNGGYPYLWELQPEETVNVTGVTLDCTEKTMNVGDVTTLIATVDPSNALNKTVIWSTSNADVAYVINGKVTACSAGTAVITVKTADGDFSATCTITVTEEVIPVINVESVSLNKANLTLAVGASEKLAATVLPANATNKKVIWTSSNNSVATVDENGTVKAIKAGNVIITAKTEDGAKTATCKLTVSKSSVSVTGVTLDKTSVTLKKGENTVITAIVSPDDASNKTVSWVSSDSSVADVVDGVVVAKGVGTALIIATTNDGGKTAFCTVTVTEDIQPDPDVPEEPDVPDEPIVETDSYIELSSAKVRAGQSFEITVSFRNNPGMNTFALKIDYDDTKLKLDSVRLCDGISGQLEYVKKAVWLNSSDLDYSGEYLTLSFTVLENAEIGDTSVSVSYNTGDICNLAEEDVNFKIKNGTVSVIDYVPGDINGDNVVNNKDLNRLMKYLAGDDVEVNELALDVNGDNVVNNKDLNRLMKYLAGDNVEIY